LTEEGINPDGRLLIAGNIGVRIDARSQEYLIDLLFVERSTKLSDVSVLELASRQLAIARNIETCKCLLLN